MGSVMGWLTAWILMFIMIYALSRTKAGQVVVYYMLWTLVVLLVVTHPNQIISVFTGGAF